MTPPKSSKESGLDNFVVRPVLCCAPRFLCSLTQPKSCFQHMPPQQLLSATGRLGHAHTQPCAIR
eukprot:1048923-Pelagomonas_calceolata.AAC.1